VAVELEVVRGKTKGAVFSFAEHDTFIFGRAADAHARIAGDPAVSRYHFLLEVNPPHARLKDLGSTNGTGVDGRKYGGKPAPGEAAPPGPMVDLRDGSEVKVGSTVFRIRLEAGARCAVCEAPIPEGQLRESEWTGGFHRCAACRAKGAASPASPRPGPGPAPAPPEAPPSPARAVEGPREGEPAAGPGAKPVEAEDAGADADGAMLGQMIAEAIDRREDPGAPEIPGYEVLQLLGKGGMGAVYLGRRRSDGERVAVKILLPKSAADDQAKRMFEREISLTRELRHPNVVGFLEEGFVGKKFYLVLEYVDGGSAEDLRKRRGGTLPLGEAAGILLQSLEGLAYAHAKGFVHRDMKPQNVLLAVQGEGFTAKVADLGLAKNYQKAGFSGFTATGTTAGTPSFMPKEQLTDFKHARPGSDVFSAGASLYFLLTGRPVYHFRPDVDPLMTVLAGDIVPLRQRDPSVPEPVAEVVNRSLAVRIEDRYSDAAGMRDALRQALAS
jgi:hypothetical protein